jgi:SAM-dependent methyltransferase
MRLLESSVWAAPRVIGSVQECDFYHTMDIPGYGKVVGEWDLRENVDTYLGNQDLKGKRVLELGSASGFLTFEMEKRGATVVGFDLADGKKWDIVPHDAEDLDQVVNQFATHLERMKNGFWLAHAANDSKARMVYGNIYDIPREIEEFDVAFFGCILLHLRDPFGALANVAPLVREKLVIAEPEWFAAPALIEILAHAIRTGPAPVRWAGRLTGPLQPHLLAHLAGIIQRHLPLIYFLPRCSAQETAEKNFHTWWHFSPQALMEYLKVLGFSRTSTFQHPQLYFGRPVNIWTIVGER